MSSAETRILARRLLAVERALLATKQPNLGNSAIADGSAILATDLDENITMIIGQQFDGTSTATVVTGPTPPIPTIPFVTSQAGALRIYWDGTFSNATVAPMDFARVIAYAKPLASLGTPDPLDQAIMVGQFTSATGSEITAALDSDVEYGVFLATWTQAGKYSPASDVAISTVGSVVTGADLATKSTIYRQDTAPWPNGDAGHSGIDIGDMWVDTTLQPGPTQSVDTWSITSNVATLNTDSTHDLSNGMSIAVVGVDPTVDGNYVISTSDPDSISFPLVHADVALTTAPDEATVQGLEVDPLNRYHIWDGATWVDTQDSGISDAATLAGGAKSQADTNAESIKAANDALATIAATAADAYSTAYAADGRVAISDYEPTDADVAGKNDGSLWITRTRDRRNIALNPSFEVNLNNWTASQCTVTRELGGISGDGTWVARITNNASTSLNHEYIHDQITVAPSETITASGYMRAVSGVCTGHWAQIQWYDASNNLINTLYGPSIDLITSASDPDGLGGWRRAYITQTAPANTSYAKISFGGPAANVNDVWGLDAVLIERSTRLGRYFDGGSEGGSWAGTAENSESNLDGDAIIRLFNLEDGAWTEKFWTADTISSLDVKVLRSGLGYVRPAGLADTDLDGGLLGDNTVAIDKNFMPNVVASEALTAGALVNVWNNAGVPMVRLAKASPGYEAHGFVLVAAGVGEQPVVYTSGYNPLQTALTPGIQFTSVTPGKCSATPPQDIGTLVQRVGQAVSATTLDFAALTSVVLT